MNISLHLSPRIQLLKQNTTFYGEKERKKKKSGKNKHQNMLHMSFVRKKKKKIYTTSRCDKRSHCIRQNEFPLYDN